ncbi:MAG: GAF and ANTAR domain-containing protein [Deltaproteobacteria bacterium]|nr:GAF and ANTAR domain-containing protein [Deltaproteobacteria bacterium]
MRRNSLSAKDKLSYVKQIEALKEISTAISSDRYIEDVLRLIVTVTANVMDSKVCSLWLIGEKEDCLKVRATQTMNKEYLKERSLKLGEGVVGNVAQQNKPSNILDVLKEPRYKEKELAKKMGLRSMLSVPMRVKDRVIGVINIYKSYLHEFTKTELDLLTTVANQAAICIENTELMVRSKVIQEELEARKKIEQAKEVLMNNRQMTGAEAYGWIRKRSMDSRKSIREVAEAVILSNEIFNDESS